MNKQTRFIIGTILFIIACFLPIIALWRYTGFGLTNKDFHISAPVFHGILVGDMILFYVQWKVCQKTWQTVRYWFSEHIWSIMFGISILVLAHSLLFFRLYIRSFSRYRSLRADISALDSKVDDLDREDLKNKMEDLERKVDDAEYRIKQAIETINHNKGKNATQPARARHEWL